MFIDYQILRDYENLLFTGIADYDHKVARKESSLEVLAKLSNLPGIRRWLDRVLRNWGTTEEVKSDLALAVTELCTNIIRHGYAGAPGSIRLNASKHADSIQICIVDGAPSFIPGKIKNPKAGDLSEGGFGLPLIRSLADEVVYEPLGERGNRVILTKYAKRRVRQMTP
jgi:serine/threonine-protein kinase RsbW